VNPHGYRSTVALRIADTVRASSRGREFLVEVPYAVGPAGLEI
jgi:hypothetical protein